MLPKICFLIDDDQDDQEIFNLALQHIEQPVTCITANDCGEALKKLEKENKFLPDFIFLDLNMPRMNGKTCLQEIKKRAHLKNIPVVMYSTSLNQRDIVETREFGASTYIIKPSNVAELATALNLFFSSSISLYSISKQSN
jgi:DNA-binding response OmpR family regulator